MKYRIVAGGIHIESSTFTPYISNEKDFTLRESDELMKRYPWANEFSEVEIVPLIHAGALPGGVVSRDFYEKWYERFVLLLEKAREEGPIHGILMDIHGAMSLEGTDDAEGDLLEKIRKIVGEDMPISTSMDLHGNVSDKLFKNTDLLTCYRTAPHIDTVETRKRAFENLIKIIRNGRKNLFRTKVDIPILLPGEKTSTEVEPGKSLYLNIEKVLEDSLLLDASIYMGFPWADQERCHAVVTVSGFNKEKVEEAACAMAKDFWGKRNKFNFVGPVAQSDVAINMALNSDVGPFFVSDTGDNPGAGGSDDMVVFLGQFLEEYKKAKSEKKILFASVMDSETARFLHTLKIGDEKDIEIGGRVDPSFSGPLKGEFKLLRLFTSIESGKAAVIAYEKFEIIVTEKRHQYSRKKFFEDAGIDDFNNYDVIIVKIGYLEPDLSVAQRGWVMALTPGAVDQDIENLKYRNLKHPIYPHDGSNFEVDLSPITIQSREVRNREDEK